MMRQSLHHPPGAPAAQLLPRTRVPNSAVAPPQQPWQHLAFKRSSRRHICYSLDPSQFERDGSILEQQQQQQLAPGGGGLQQQWSQNGNRHAAGAVTASLQGNNSPPDPAPLPQPQQPGSSAPTPQPQPQQQPQQPYPASIQQQQPVPQQMANPQQQQQQADPAAAAAAAVVTSSSTADSPQQQQQQQQQQQPWPPDVPWGMDTVLGVLSLWLLAYVAIGQVVMPAVLSLLDLERAAMSARELALLNLSVDCVQAALTLLMLAKCLGRYRPRTRGLFPLRWQQGRWLTWVTAGVGCFPVIDWVWKQGVSLLTGADIQADMFQTQIELGLYTGDVITIACYAIIVGVLAPLWEEVLFRGFLLPSLAKVVTPWPAVALTALLFAWLHSSSEAIMPLLLVALGCGALLVRFDNLLPSILLHGLYNLYVFANMAVQLYCDCGPVTASLSVSFGAAAVLLVAAVINNYCSCNSSGSSSNSSGSSSSSQSGSSGSGSRGGERPPPLAAGQP